jgi:rubrerythrin
MAFNQTRDVLNHVRQYHLRLSGFYEALKSSAGNESARGLLDYLSRHERHVETCMVMYEEQVSDNVLDTYFKYESECTHMSKIDQFERKPEMDVSDITAAAMYFNTCLVSFCREMAERALSEKVREVFENMLKMELHEQHRLSMQLLEMV